MLAASLSFMTRWAECLHGNGSLRETLSDFAELSQAVVVHLYRVNAATGTQHTVATFDRQAPEGKRPMIRAHGTALAGDTQSRAKPGTLWSMHELDRNVAGNLDPRVLGWMDSRGFRDALIIPLSVAGEETDVLELHLTAPLDVQRRRVIETLAVAMAEAWGRRPKGRIARLLRAAPAIQDRLAPGRAVDDPLSESNPFGLTAAELRICGMIRQGVPIGQASKSLGIADSTVRTHLRSIFAKAGVAGQVGLVRMLLQSETTRPAMRA